MVELTALSQHSKELITKTYKLDARDFTIRMLYRLLLSWYHLHWHWTDNLSFIQYILCKFVHFTL